jgi:hypothetical protein
MDPENWIVTFLFGNNQIGSFYDGGKRDRSFAVKLLVPHLEQHNASVVEMTTLPLLWGIPELEEELGNNMLSVKKVLLVKC